MSWFLRGGTLLARNYLEYPRISEDIDFTYEKSNLIRKLGTKQKRETKIKKIVVPIIDDFKVICDKINFDFSTDRRNTDYIKVMNSRAVYILHVYYKSLITGEKNPIKIEINFLDEIIHDYSKLEIKNIVSIDAELKSLEYDLKNIRINAYSLDEIIIEKYRAVLTRPKLKERDVLDFYLIDKKKDRNILETKNELIVKKIKSAKIISPNLNKNIKNNCKLLNEGIFDNSNDDIDSLIIIKIDKDEYNEFKKKLFDKLSDICKLF